MKRLENKLSKAKWIPPLSIFAGLCVWELFVKFSKYPAFILPAPSRIAQRFVSASKSAPEVMISTQFCGTSYCSA